MKEKTAIFIIVAFIVLAVITHVMRERDFSNAQHEAEPPHKSRTVQEGTPVPMRNAQLSDASPAQQSVLELPDVLLPHRQAIKNFLAQEHKLRPRIVVFPDFLSKVGEEQTPEDLAFENETDPQKIDEAIAKSREEVLRVLSSEDRRRALEELEAAEDTLREKLGGEVYQEFLKWREKTNYVEIGQNP